MADVELRVRNGAAGGIAGLKELRAQFVEARRDAASMSAQMKENGALAIDSARKQVEAEKAKIQLLRDQIAVGKELTASYKRGSDERQIATRMEIEMQRKLQAALGETAAVAAKGARSSARRSEESGLARGAASRSGVAGAGLAGLAGPGFIVGAVAAGVLDASVKVAMRAQQAEAQLQNALKDTGVSYAKNREEINRTLEAEEKKSGFDKMELEQSLQMLIRSTGSLKKAQSEEADMVNIARARHTDLHGAMMLVLRASQGNTGALRRLGIDIPKVTDSVDKLKAAHLTGNVALMARAKALDLAATKEEVMAAVHGKFAGAAAAYTHTFAGETDALKNTLRDLGITIGEKVIPVLARLFQWLNTKGIDDLKRAYKELKPYVVDTAHGVEGFVKAFGGWGNVIELVLAGVAAWKAYKIAMATAALATRVEAVLTGETIDAALISTGIGALVVAVGVAAVLVIQHFQQIKEWIKKFADWIAIIAPILLGPIVGGMIAATVEIIKHWGAVKSFLADFWEWLRKSADQAALDVVEPFSHIPGSMGAWARKAKDAIKKDLWDMEVSDAQRAGKAAAAAFEKEVEAVFGTIAQQEAKLHQPGVGDFTGSAGGASQSRGAAGAPKQAGIVAGKIVSAGNQYGPSSGATYARGGGHGGQVAPGHVLDCSGYVYQVFSAAGFQGFPGTSEAQWSTMRGPNWVSEIIAKNIAGPGDEVFFNEGPDAAPGHCGLIVSGNGDSAEYIEYYSSGKPAKYSKGFAGRNVAGFKRFWIVDKQTGKAMTGGGGSVGSAKPPKPTGGGGAALDAAIAAAQAAKEAAKAQKKAAAAAKAQARKDAAYYDQVPQELQDNLRKAEATSDYYDDDIKALQAVVTWLKKRIHVTTDINALRKLEKEKHQAETQIAIDRRRQADVLAKVDKQITDIEKKLPANADAVERDAEAHLEKIRKAMRPGMSQAELKHDQDEVKKWGKVITDELRKQAAEARKAAAEAKKQFDAAWQLDVTKIDRGISEAWNLQMRGFNRETASHLQQMARAAQAAVQSMQRQFQQQMVAFDAETQRGLTSRAAPAMTPTEKLLADRAEAQTVQGLQDALATAQASGDPKQIAQAQYDIETHALEKQAALERDAADKAAQAAQDTYQRQRDALKQSLEDAEAAREQAYQDQADAAAQAYQDQRDAQQQALQDQHDDEVAAFNASLDTWGTMIYEKKKTWADFLAWLAANPTTPGDPGSQNVPTDVSGASAGTITDTAISYQNAKQTADPAIAKHAAGGIHWRPSIGMLGDQGPEATLPLTGQRGQEVIKMLADAVANAGGGGSGQTIIYGTFLGATERQVGRALEGLVTPQQGRVARYKAPY